MREQLAEEIAAYLQRLPEVGEMTVREEIAETIRAYMMQLPPIADKPRRVELVIEFPSATERHEIIKEIKK